LTKRKKQKLPPWGYAFTDNNVLLSADVKLSLNTYHTHRNLNSIILGVPGTGKTRGFLLPNLLQGNTSYVITDPKGEILRASGKFLSAMGYEIKVFNLIDMKNSGNYNPFDYVYNNDGSIDYNAVKKMVTVLMKNVAGKSDKSGGGDPYWDMQAEKVITAIAILLLEEGAKSQRNFAAVADKMRGFQTNPNEKDKEFKSELDKEFEALERHNPRSLGVMFYKEFKQSSNKGLQSIISVANSKLQYFEFPDVRNLTFTDTLGLETVGDKKTAMFILISSSDSSFNFLAAMMYTQMFDILFNRANFKYGGALPIHVRFLLDEFANVGEIPAFEDLIATMRSMNISANVILQDLAQLKKMYKESWGTINACCDTLLFLGGTDVDTNERISKLLGKETIDVKGQNRTKGARQSSTSENNSILGRELLTPDEVGRMPDEDCIVQVRGYNPFYCKKCDLLSHPNYRYSGLADKRNAYDWREVKTLIAPSYTAEEETQIKAQKKIFVKKSVIKTALYLRNDDVLSPAGTDDILDFVSQEASKIDILSGGGTEYDLDFGIYTDIGGFSFSERQNEYK
jgi:type IV secretion system protein VirD4